MLASVMLSKWLLGWVVILSWLICIITYSIANKGQTTVNYCQSSADDHPYLSCNDHCDQWVFQEIIFIIISKKFFWTILNLMSWNLNTFTKLTEQVCFLFSCSFFSPFHTFPLSVNTLDESVLFLLVIDALHLLYFLHEKWYKREN